MVEAQNIFQVSDFLMPTVKVVWAHFGKHHFNSQTLPLIEKAGSSVTCRCGRGGTETTDGQLGHLDKVFLAQEQCKHHHVLSPLCHLKSQLLLEDSVNLL